MIHASDVFLLPVKTSSSFNMSTCSFYSRTHFNLDLKIVLVFIPFPFRDVLKRKKREAIFPVALRPPFINKLTPHLKNELHFQVYPWREFISLWTRNICLVVKLIIISFGVYGQRWLSFCNLFVHVCRPCLIPRVIVYPLTSTRLVRKGVGPPGSVVLTYQMHSAS